MSSSRIPRSSTRFFFHSCRLAPSSRTWISVEFSRSDDFNLSTGRKKSGTHSNRGGPRLVLGWARLVLLHSLAFWLGYRLFALSLFFPLSVLPSPHYFLSPLLFDCHCFLSQRELELVTWELSCLGEDVRRTNERLEREGEEDRDRGRNFVRLFRHRRNSWQKEGFGRGQGKGMHAGYEAIGVARKLRRLKRSSMIRSRRKRIESVTPSRLIYTSIYI